MCVMALGCVERRYSCGLAAGRCDPIQRRAVVWRKHDNIVAVPRASDDRARVTNGAHRPTRNRDSSKFPIRAKRDKPTIG